MCTRLIRTPQKENSERVIVIDESEKELSLSDIRIEQAIIIGMLRDEVNQKSNFGK